MKNAKCIEKFIRIAAVAVLALAAYKCTSQTDFRLITSPGLVIASESGDPDEICINFGVKSGEVKVKHLGKSGDNLKKRMAAAVRMADEAGVSYKDFLIENGLKDSNAIQTYFAKCRKLRAQFLSLMPERALLEIRHITERFK